MQCKILSIYVDSKKYYYIDYYSTSESEAERSIDIHPLRRTIHQEIFKALYHKCTCHCMCVYMHAHSFGLVNNDSLCIHACT